MTHVHARRGVEGPPVQAAALRAAAAGLLVAVVGLFIDAGAFFKGYLFAFAFWTGLSLGCLSLLMLHHLVAGGWGLVSQRILESGAYVIVIMALFFFPVLAGMHELYEWTHEEAVRRSEVLQHKSAYLNIPFFAARSVMYFGFWISAAILLGRWTGRQDETADPRFAVKLRRFSAGALIAHVLVVTFASVDWLMSLEPEWYSSIYGFLLMVSHTLTALAVTIIVLYHVRHLDPLNRVLRTGHFHDLGNLLLTFVILWTYMMFAQYLIIWAGHIPEDIRWYVHRSRGFWFWSGPFLIVFHFAVPFFLLLLRRTKRSARALSALAGALLLVHVVFTAWLILPSYAALNANVIWIGGAAWIGIGGCWATLFLARLDKRPLLPRYDPRFKELLRDA